MSQLSIPVTAKDHSAGPSSAPVTLVEYGDYECPSCGQAYSIVKRLEKHFGNKLRFIFRNFPLEMHPNAEHAAEAAEFAAAHNKFWLMHDLLFENQQRLSDEDLFKYATDLGLSAATIRDALIAGTYRSRVAMDLKSGDESGVTGTPMFYINGVRYEDSYDYQTLAQAIEDAV